MDRGGNARRYQRGAQTNVRVRGTIAAIDGNVLIVKSRDVATSRSSCREPERGARASIERSQVTTWGDDEAGPRRIGGRVEVITSHRRPRRPARLGPAARFDLTNANVGAIVRPLASEYAVLQGGTQRIFARCRCAGGTTDVVGEYVFIGAQAAAAQRVTSQQGRRETAE